MIAIKQVWSLGERVFGEEFKSRMFLFDSLIKSFILYAAEVWGWSTLPKLESIQTRYLKWILRLEYATPGYLVMEETKRKKLSIESGKRAILFEVKIRKGQKNKILYEIVKEIDKNKGLKSAWVKERRLYLQRNGMSPECIKRNVEEGTRIVEELVRVDEENQLKY